MPWRDLAPDEAVAFLRDNPHWIVLDVRTPPEFEWHRIEGALLLPIQELEERLAELDRTRPHAVVCEHGVRSEAACEYLAEQGFEQLINIQGGMAHWLTRGLPIVAGPVDEPAIGQPREDQPQPRRFWKRLFGD